MPKLLCLKVMENIVNNKLFKINTYSISLCCLLVFSLPVQAEIYKWKDEHGRTHYGDKPVDNQAEEVEYKSTTTTGKGNAASWQEIQARQEKFLDYLEEERQARDEKRQKQLEVIAQRNKQCDEAKAHRDELISIPVFYRVDEQGNKEFISTEEKDENLEKTETFISKHCKD